MSDPDRKECSYSEKPNNSDLIYRQDALDILEDFETCVYEATGGAYEKARKAMCELQSQPEKRTQERTETHACDSISRQDALDILRMCYETERIDYTNGGEYINYNQAVHEVEQAPSAQTEIIRCTECKHYREYDSEYVENAVVVQCMADRYPISETIPDGWFCAGAERKDDE